MINVVYLVLIMNISSGTASVIIPQANAKQCEVNSKYMKEQRHIYDTYCVVGVK